MPLTSPKEVRSAPVAVSWLPFPVFAWFVLAYNCAVALWGAFVRATGSGAGCGPNWPLCNGTVTPRSPSIETIIEFTHRTTSGVDLLLVAVLVVWAHRAFPRRHPVRLGAKLSGIFLMTEALLGAALVLLEHVAKNTSSARAWSLSTHLINTLTLLACLTLTAWWGMGRPRLSLRGPGRIAAAASVAVFALLGITGAIAALGDTLFPVQSLAEGLAQDLNPEANLFVRLRWLHPVVAALGGCWLLYYAVSRLRFPELRPHALLALGLLVTQLCAGMINLLLLAPVWMQILHLLFAYAAWIALVWLCASTMTAASDTTLK